MRLRESNPLTATSKRASPTGRWGVHRDGRRMGYSCWMAFSEFRCCILMVRLVRDVFRNVDSNTAESGQSSFHHPFQQNTRAIPKTVRETSRGPQIESWSSTHRPRRLNFAPRVANLARPRPVAYEKSTMSPLSVLNPQSRYRCALLIESPNPTWQLFRSWSYSITGGGGNSRLQNSQIRSHQNQLQVQL